MREQLTIKKLVLLITYAVLLYVAAINYSSVFSVIATGLNVLQPFFYGIAFAFIFNILMKKVENFLQGAIKGATERAIRGLSVFLTVVIFVGGVALFFALLIPQLAASISTLVQSIPGYAKIVADFTLNLIEKLSIQFTLDDFKNLPWQEWLQKTTQLLQEYFPRLFSSTATFTGTVTNVFMGLIISIYMLFNKEVLIAQLKRATYAFLPRKLSDKMVEIGGLTCKIMTGFVSGQITEAFILGILCFIGMTFLRMPYAPLIAVIIGATNLIPFFGPVLGTIPCAFIILMNNPVSALVFVIFILVLQQIDSNIIYPRVVGDSVNLPAMWIMLSILIGGGLFGLIGMLLGVPVFAVIYAIFGSYVNERYRTRMQREKP